MIRSLVSLCLSATLVALCTSISWSGGAKHLASTMGGLQQAYGEEWNSYLTYRAYALEAEREAAPAAALLFRATAQAELVHLALHAAVMRWIGAEPVVPDGHPDVGSLKENLACALVNEHHECDELYTPLALSIEVERVEPAIRSIRYAHDAEITHALLYEELIKHYQLVAAWGDSLAPRWTTKHLFVCPTCGRVDKTSPTGHCPTCYADAKDLLTVR